MNIITKDTYYRSRESKPSWFARRAPDLYFYPQLIFSVILKSSRLAKRGLYNDEKWVDSSIRTLKALESIGIRVEVENINTFRDLDSPCVFIGNHMSTLETFFLPCIIQPIRKVTYVVKESLISYPVFKHIMISRDPIVVGRTDPRADFKAVLEGGEERLNKKISIIVFPQTTRTPDFDPDQFNSIGIKLAKKAGVPIVPIALKTDAWGNGKMIKDFGKMRPERPVFFSFGNPMTVSGNGREEHLKIIHFIEDKLHSWQTQ